MMAHSTANVVFLALVTAIVVGGKRVSTPTLVVFALLTVATQATGVTAHPEVSDGIATDEHARDNDWFTAIQMNFGSLQPRWTQVSRLHADAILGQEAKIPSSDMTRRASNVHLS